MSHCWHSTGALILREHRTLSHAALIFIELSYNRDIYCTGLESPSDPSIDGVADGAGAGATRDAST
jgi:hypothetical protein